MRKVKEIIKDGDFNQIYELYKKEVKNNTYEKIEEDVFEKIKIYCEKAKTEISNIKDEDTHSVIVITKREDGFYCFLCDKNEVSNKYIEDLTIDVIQKGYIVEDYLDFHLWNYLANCDVSDLSISKYGIEQVIAIILYHMTSYGFTSEMVENGIKEQTSKIVKMLKESEKQDPSTYRSADEVFEELRLKYGLEEKESTPSTEEVIRRIFNEYLELQPFYKEIKESMGD